MSLTHVLVMTWSFDAWGLGDDGYADMSGISSHLRLRVHEATEGHEWVLIQARTMLMSVTHVTTEAQEDILGLSCYLNPY